MSRIKLSKIKYPYNLFTPESRTSRQYITSIPIFTSQKQNKRHSPIRKKLIKNQHKHLRSIAAFPAETSTQTSDCKLSNVYTTPKSRPTMESDPTPSLKSTATSATTLPTELRYINYSNILEAQYLPSIRALISKDLSEPYSIYVYRYFLCQWGDLCFLVCLFSFPFQFSVHSAQPTSKPSTISKSILTNIPPPPLLGN